MHIIVLSTSGRSNGNTSRVLKIMLDKLASLGATTEFIWTGNKKIEFCRACRPACPACLSGRQVGR